MEYHVPTPLFDGMTIEDKRRVRRKILYMAKICGYCGNKNDRYPKKYCSKCATNEKRD